MKIHTDQAILEVGPARLLCMRKAAGTTIVCEAGIVWITQDYEMEDVVLCRGETHVIMGRRPVMVSGFEPSRIRVCHPAVSGKRLRWIRKLRPLFFSYRGWTRGYGALAGT